MCVPQDKIMSRMRRPDKITTLLLLGTISCVAQAPQSAAQTSAWRHLGPPGGNVISLAISTKNVIYLGTPDGHIFESADGAQHWVLRSRVTTRHDAVTQKLLVNVQHDNEILAAVWFQDVREGGGLFISHDSGATWTLAGLSGEVVRTVEQSPSSPDIFVAGTRSGVFRSTDGARTWQRISPEGDPELRNVDSLAIDPHDAQIIYAGTYHLPWKTGDGGKHWTAVATGMIDDSDVMSLRVDATSSARIFASACSGIYRSENAGAVWTKLQGIPFSSRRTQSIVQDVGDPRTLYAATTEGLWVTRDSGESWTRTTPRDWVVNDVKVLLSKSATGGPSLEILLGTEQQGILISRDAGQTFTAANDGLFHRITAALVNDPQDGNHLLAWMPDSPDPLVESRDGGATWTSLAVAATPDNAPVDISRIFSTEVGWWAATSSGRLEFYNANARKWDAVKFVSPVPRSSRAAYSSDPVQRRATLRPNAAAVIAAADITDVRTVGARIFVATSQALWSATFSDKSLRRVRISSLRTTESPDITGAAAAFWMIAAGKILRSQDAGKTWHEETLNPSADSPDPAIRWIREVHVDDSAESMLLAATSKGLYRRVGSGPWRLVQSGLATGEPLAYFSQGRVFLVTLRAGGLYLSRDATQTWERLDTSDIAGQFTGAVSTANHQIAAASLTEGLVAAAF